MNQFQIDQISAFTQNITNITKENIIFLYNLLSLDGSINPGAQFIISIDTIHKYVI